jgi:outer membrane biosynthesis protein TonB
MKTSRAALLFVLAPALGFAQPQPGQSLDQVTSKPFLQQLIQDDVYFFIAPKVAESLLIHRVEPALPHGDMTARFSGTVIIAFEITREGKVRHAMAVSGPALLRPAVLAAVKQWTFKPFVLNGEATTVATSIPLTMSNF